MADKFKVQAYGDYYQVDGCHSLFMEYTIDNALDLARSIYAIQREADECDYQLAFIDITDMQTGEMVSMKND